jgi:hypothetical protein
MWVQIKLIFLTIVVTGLIWFYADQAIKETETLVLTATVTSGKDLIPRIVKPSGGNVEVVVKGSAKDISRARKDSQSGKLGSFTIALADLDYGAHSIDLRSRVEDSAMFSDRNLVLVSVSPVELVVDVDKKVRREVKLAPVKPVGVQFVDGPTFDPPAVTVEYPFSREKDLRVEEGIMIGIADYVAGQAAGERLIRRVPMPVSLGDQKSPVPVECYPKQVSLRLTLQSSQFEDFLSDSIPVRLLVAPDLIGKYEVEFKQGDAAKFDRPKVKGPREVLAALTPQDVHAYILLARDDVKESVANPEKWLSRPIQYNFPSQEVSLVGQPTLVDVRARPAHPSSEPTDVK